MGHITLGCSTFTLENKIAFSVVSSKIEMTRKKEPSIIFRNVSLVVKSNKLSVIVICDRISFISLICELNFISFWLSL